MTTAKGGSTAGTAPVTATATVTTAPATTTTPAPPPAPAPAPAVGGVVDEVTLNWTDLTGKKTGATTLGSNKFYKAQIVTETTGFTVVFTYGRVGQAGQTQTVTAATLDAARRAMNAKVDEKVKKGYTRIQLRSVHEERTKAEAHTTATPGSTVEATAVVAPVVKTPRTTPSVKFHPEVESLLRLIYGATGEAVAAGLSASAGATANAPLGNLSDTQLDKGADILEKVEALVKGGGKASRNDLVDLTNEYLSNIPRNIDGARKKGKLDLSAILLDSEERIGTQRKFITLLRDAYLQREVFAEAALADDPVEVWYDGLKCDIEYLDPKSDAWARVVRLFDTGQSPHNSNFAGKLKVLRVWRLEQQERRAPFDAFAATVIHKPGATGMLDAWHGTRTENIMGVCKSGLRMPDNLPKGVYVTGKTFGLGIYHTPCWPDSGVDRKDAKGKKYVTYNGALKSMNYTSLRGAFYGNSNTARTGYMFLEQLALGVPEVAHKVCWNKARPDPGCDYIYAEAHGHESLTHDEVVTFHEHASRRSHLIEVGYR